MPKIPRPGSIFWSSLRVNTYVYERYIPLARKKGNCGRWIQMDGLHTQVSTLSWPPYQPQTVSLPSNWDGGQSPVEAVGFEPPT